MTKVKSLIKDYENAMRSIGESIGTPSPAKKINENFIFALDGITKHTLSPMLIDRFTYCDEWNDFYLSQNMLSLKKINSFPYESKLNQWIDLRKENWDHVPPRKTGDSMCSIFSFNPYEPEEIYLDWSEERIEPAIWHCSQSDYYGYNNLEEFFEKIAEI